MILISPAWGKKEENILEYMKGFGFGGVQTFESFGGLQKFSFSTLVKWRLFYFILHFTLLLWGVDIADRGEETIIS